MTSRTGSSICSVLCKAHSFSYYRTESLTFIFSIFINLSIYDLCSIFLSDIGMLLQYKIKILPQKKIFDYILNVYLLKIIIIVWSFNYFLYILINISIYFYYWTKFKRKSSSYFLVNTLRFPKYSFLFWNFLKRKMWVLLYVLV